MARDKMRKDVRKKMLKELKSAMKSDMYGPMKEGMQKVTVASDSEKGLEEGLSKAQKILKKRKEMMEGEEYAGGGVKERTTEAPESLGKGEGEYRGYKEDPYITKKKPKYLDHRKEFPKLMKDQYADGGCKSGSKAEKIKALMKKRKKY